MVIFLYNIENTMVLFFTAETVPINFILKNEYGGCLQLKTTSVEYKYTY